VTSEGAILPDLSLARTNGGLRGLLVSLLTSMLPQLDGWGPQR
jgi:hypothetical protein